MLSINPGSFKFMQGTFKISRSFNFKGNLPQSCRSGPGPFLELVMEQKEMPNLRLLVREPKC